jgi:hypothetical protein
MKQIPHLNNEIPSKGESFSVWESFKISDLQQMTSFIFSNSKINYVGNIKLQCVPECTTVTGCPSRCRLCNIAAAFRDMIKGTSCRIWLILK